MENVKPQYSLRLVNLKDGRTIFKWANDPAVRRWSFNDNLIQFDEHKTWFNNKLNDSNVLMWIFEENTNPAGLVRLEKKNDKVLLNYLIAPESRGKGLAGKMLKKAIHEVKSHWSNLTILAFTLSDNIASIKSLQKAGFYLESIDDKNNCYVYK